MQFIIISSTKRQSQCGEVRRATTWWEKSENPINLTQAYVFPFSFPFVRQGDA
jgi:hypothetical protein